MKKLLITLLTFAAIAILGSYFFIPAKIKIASSISISANHEGVFRVLSDTSNWKRWWPGEKIKDADGKDVLSCNGINFKLNKLLYSQFELNIKGNKLSAIGNLKLFPLSADSSLYEMSTEINAGSNPFKRITGYFKARKLKTAFNKILEALNKYASNQENIYGLSIKKEKVQYDYLVAMRKNFSDYPTTEQVYSIVEDLRKYISVMGAGEILFPMLNVIKIDNSNYEVQVGLPINKKVPDTKDISTKWMMREGNILSAEVTGDRQQIEDAFKKFDIYVQEYKRSIIAIPFQMLITDRSKEPDSTKWVTRLYYPVV